MRPFLRAGSSLLALSALVATASARTVTFINSSAGLDGQVPTGFVQGDVLVNPDGLFTGILQNDGNFVVTLGTNSYNASNRQILWAAGYSNSSNGAYGLGNYRGNTKLFDTSLTSYYVYKNDNPSTSFYELAGSNYYNAPTFLRLNNNGSLSIYPGTNGVATGAAITTVGGATANLKSIDLTSIDYDFSKATLSNAVPVAGAAVKATNNTPTKQTYPITVTLEHTDTQTFTWGVSYAVTYSIESTGAIGIPGITSETTLGVSQTTTISKGESTSSGDTTAFQVGVDLAVPAHSVYKAFIVATKGTSTVPYTFTGTAYYDNTGYAPVSGSGLFSGVSTGAFEVETECVSSPTNCAGFVATRVPVSGLGSTGSTVR